MTLISDATPEMIAWFRKCEHYTIEQVAELEGWPTSRIESWETGKASPSLAQLRRLAKRYKRPTMAFYLPSPPAFSVVKLKDYRLLPPNQSRDFSVPLQSALRVLGDRQLWVSSYVQAAGSTKWRPFGRVTISTRPVLVGENLRSLLGVSLEEQLSFTSESTAFTRWKSAVESTGVFVFQVPGIDIREMRGCAMFDPYAPLIIINSRDSYSARIFTLLHEYAHLLLGASAITAGGVDGVRRKSRQVEERFCNAVAAETIVPQDDIIARLPSNWRSRAPNVLGGLASTYRISRAVIAKRLVEIGVASDQWLREVWPSISSNAPPPRGGPIPPHELVLSRYGSLFTRMALSAYEVGDIHGGQFTDLTGLRLKNLPKLYGEVYPTKLHA